MGKHKARHAIGERGLADALRAAQQPCMRDASAAIGVEQYCFRFTMSEEGRGFTGMSWPADPRITSILTI